MISDFVKGKKKFEYPADMQQGIMLHRAIDHFTDMHEATKQAKEIFRPLYRLYIDAFVDVFYDHVLDRDESEFTETILYEFTSRVYEVLEDNLEWLPERFAGMFPFMRQQNWLF